MSISSDSSFEAENYVERKIEDALNILRALDFPRSQLNNRSALTLLALLDLRPASPWREAGMPLVGITPVMDWIQVYYEKKYKPNTRETFRRQTMHQFVDAGLALVNPDQPNRAVNSPKTVYQIEPQALELLRTFGTEQWHAALAQYQQQHESLRARYAQLRKMNRIPISLAGGSELTLTPGKHSRLIKAIIEEFVPRYAIRSHVLYIGDTGKKWAYSDEMALKQLGVNLDVHGKMPDVVLYHPGKAWLLLIEAVTSHGPVDGKRHDELARLFGNLGVGIVYVTAFPTRSDLARYVTQISWETEVWVADAPDHLIHFDGERFLGPYGSPENES